MKYRHKGREIRNAKSLSSRRAWIEISHNQTVYLDGEGSLSSRRAWIEIVRADATPSNWKTSLSSRRAWIEIRLQASRWTSPWSLSSRRAWIEISPIVRHNPAHARRSPHGERGLKCSCGSIAVCGWRSLSSRRAWIEIQTGQKCANVYLSLSSRRAWIEIPSRIISSRGVVVALLTESVD